MSYSIEAYEAANDVINDLDVAGYDYSPYREEIVRLIDEELWQGNWVSTTDIGIEGIPELRFIEENHYDQHMDDDPNRPKWKDMIVHSHWYIWKV